MKTNTSLYLPVETKTDVQAVSERHGISAAEVIRRAVQAGLSDSSPEQWQAWAATLVKPRKPKLKGSERKVMFALALYSPQYTSALRTLDQIRQITLLGRGVTLRALDALIGKGLVVADGECWRKVEG